MEYLHGGVGFMVVETKKNFKKLSKVIFII